MTTQKTQMQRKSIGWIVAAAATAAAGIFVLDMFIPMGIAVPMFYVLPILITRLASGRRITIVTGGCCIILTSLGIAISPGEVTTAVLGDRAMATTLLLIVAALVIRDKTLMQQAVDADRALRESEERLRLAFEGADMGSWDVDVRTGQARWNHRHALLHGYAPNQAPVSIQGWKDRVHPDDLDRVMAHIEQAKLARGPFSIDHRVVCDGGRETRWISLYGRFSYDAAGEPVRFSGVSLDISERKRGEELLQHMNTALEQRVRERTAALAEANERFDWVARATNDGIWDCDLLRHTTYFSPRWKEMHGFQEQDRSESQQEWLARIHPEDRQRVLDHFEAALRGEKEGLSEEYRIQRKDGTYFWVFDRGLTLFNDQGQVFRMIGAESEITWRKEAEQAMRRREHEFRALADNVPALFAYIDRERRYRFVNKRYEDVFGRAGEEIMEMTMRELLGAEGYIAVRPFVDQALKGQPVSFEYRLPVSGAGERWLAAQYVPDRDEHGLITGMFVLQTDITQQKLSELQLRELSGRLLTVQEEERRRISRDLHDDVMQRMGALTLDLYGLASSTSSQDMEVSSQLKACGASAEQLTTDLQRMAHQLHPSVLEYVGLEVAMREHVHDFAARTGLSAEFIARDVPRNVPREHATCLYRVLQEGLQNVQKHANATTVLVRLLWTGQGLGLCVHDDGRGIEEIDGAVRRQGLGLSSMAERVGILNGTFRIRTKPGEGTEIHAWVPLEVDGYYG
ncbi:MAG: PAS domain-containing protein [Nitrospira sp.]|nr:PAS domain-containing protein [Nitrospira sp.]